MKIIHSFWGIALIGLFSNLLVVSGLMLRFYSNLMGELAPQHREVMTSEPASDEQGPAWSFRFGSIENLASELRSERNHLALKRADIEEEKARMRAEAEEVKRLRKDLELYESELEGARKAIDKAKEKLQSEIVEVHQNEQKNLKILASAYANITPEAAVLIFKEMDDKLAVKILAQMKPESIANIFQQMTHTVDNTQGKDGKTLAKKVADLSEKLRLLQQGKAKTP